MEIVLLESLGISRELLDSYAKKLEEKGHTFHAYEKDTDPEVQKKRCENADVVIIANMPFADEVIRNCPKLKFIDVAFTGVDHVGLEAAKEKGIAVSNASGYSNESVAELVLGMMLTLLRNVPQVNKRCREGGTKDGLVGREIMGKKIGIVGTGAIGKRVAQICHGLGCEILGYDPKPSADAPEYIRYLTLEDLMREADIVTMHCPLMESTYHLIHRENLALMKKNAIFTNAARGPVVDSQARADALTEGRIAAAGVDVYETEPPLPADHPLLHTPNTITTPHIAFASEESMVRRAEIVFDSLNQWMNGNQINKIL